MHVYAHRGASVECPENTLASFRRALELKPFGIELDLHLSADGVPMVIHDDTVDRTTNGSGAVSSLTCKEMQTLDAGGGERIPTLDEVLALMAGHAHLLLEIKDAAVIPAMLERVRASPELRWSAMSFNWVALRAVKDAEPDADLWLSNMGDIELLRSARPDFAPRQTLDEAIDAARALQASTLATYNLAIDSSVVARIHEAGFACWAWTVNEADRMETLVWWGVASLCTDDSRLALTLRG
ncbi:MAG: glycerophosphodiester phosphodiesterase [Thermomicrobiales bacterium]